MKVQRLPEFDFHCVEHQSHLFKKLQRVSSSHVSRSGDRNLTFNRKKPPIERWSTICPNWFVLGERNRQLAAGQKVPAPIVGRYLLDDGDSFHDLFDL